MTQHFGDILCHICKFSFFVTNSGLQLKEGEDGKESYKQAVRKRRVRKD